MTLRSRHMGILIVIILAMSYVAVTGIGADSIWHDEYRSIYYAGGMSDSTGSPLDAIARASERQTGDGLLYPLLLAVWGRIAGFSVVAARYLSLLFGVLAIAWIYRLASDLHSPSAGLLAAIALGASAFFSVYLHEIGAYSLIVLEVVLLLWLYWLILHQGPTRLSAFTFLLVLTATLYTSPLAIVSIAALGVYHLLLAPRTKSWNLLIVLAIVAEVLFVPWLLTTNSATVKFVEHPAGYSAVGDSFYLLQNIGQRIWQWYLAVLAAPILQPALAARAYQPENALAGGHKRLCCNARGLPSFRSLIACSLHGSSIAHICASIWHRLARSWVNRGA